MAFAKLGAKVTIVEALPKILPLYDEELTQPVARRARRSRDRDDARRAGARLRQGRAQGRRRRRRRDERSRPKRCWSRSGGAPRTVGFGLERLDLTMAGPVHPHRRPLRDLDAQRLGGRRRDRRADARPSRHGAGRDGRRDHRRREARLRPSGDPGDLLHRPGDRRGRACRPRPRRRRTARSSSASSPSAPTGGR